MSRTSNSSYGIRRKMSKGHRYHEISVPNDIGAAVPEGVKFVFEWHEEGILLRPVRPSSSKPSWLTESEGP